MSLPILIEENTTRPEQCRESLEVRRLGQWFHTEKHVCRLFTPHDGPHKTYIDKIGWHAWEPKEQP
jgi:hypothetical protein